MFAHITVCPDTIHMYIDFLKFISNHSKQLNYRVTFLFLGSSRQLNWKKHMFLKTEIDYKRPSDNIHRWELHVLMSDQYIHFAAVLLDRSLFNQYIRSVYYDTPTKQVDGEVSRILDHILTPPQQLLSKGGTSHRLSKGESSLPVEESHFSCFYSPSHSVPTVSDWWMSECKRKALPFGSVLSSPQQTNIEPVSLQMPHLSNSRSVLPSLVNLQMYLIWEGFPPLSVWESWFKTCSRQFSGPTLPADPLETNLTLLHV